MFIGHCPVKVLAANDNDDLDAGSDGGGERVWG